MQTHKNAALKEFIKRSLTGVVLLISFGGAYLHSALLFSLALAVILIVTLIYEWPLLVTLSRPSRILFSILYPGFPFGALVFLTLKYYQTDFYLPLFPIITAWTADSGGYAVGKLIGYHKMCPSISPGKSWEGFAGSVLAVFVMYTLLLPHIHLFAHSIFATSITARALFALVMTSIAFVGGLFLSVLKRRRGLKDAGHILPGHGGFLDRFDAVLFVALATMLLVAGY